MFSSDSKTLVITTYQDITLWDVAQAERIQTLPYVMGGNPEHSAFSADNKYIATAGEEGIQVVNRASNTLVYTIPYQPGSVGGRMAFSPNGATIAVAENRTDPGSTYPLVRLFDATDGSLQDAILGLSGLHGTMVQFTSDSQHLLIWSGVRESPPQDWGLWLWDLQQGKRIAALPDHALSSPDGRIVLANDAANNQTVVWMLAADSSTYSEQYTLRNQCAGRWVIGFFAHGNRLFTLTNAYHEDFGFPEQPTVCVIRFKEDDIIWQSNAQQGQCVAIAPNNQIAALCVSDRIQIWDIPNDWYQ